MRRLNPKQPAPLAQPLKLAQLIQLTYLLNNKFGLTQEQAYSWLVTANESIDGKRKPIECFNSPLCITLLKELNELAVLPT